MYISASINSFIGPAVSLMTGHLPHACETHMPRPRCAPLKPTKRQYLSTTLVPLWWKGARVGMFLTTPVWLTHVAFAAKVGLISNTQEHPS